MAKLTSTLCVMCGGRYADIDMRLHMFGEHNIDLLEHKPSPVRESHASKIFEVEATEPLSPGQILLKTSGSPKTCECGTDYRTEKTVTYENYVRRRKICQNPRCNNRVTTYELVVGEDGDDSN